MKRFGIVLVVFLLLGMAEGVFAQTGKKAVMIIASSNFRDEELFVTRGILESGGVEVTIASTTTASAQGVLGGVAKPDVLIGDVDVASYNAVIFVGGPGASEYWNSPAAHKIAQDAAAGNKVVAAICIAPVTLANAGILQGKKATVWFTEGGALKKLGAVYTRGPVEVDGNIVTANGPGVSKEFGYAILQALR